MLHTKHEFVLFIEFAGLEKEARHLLSLVVLDDICGRIAHSHIGIEATACKDTDQKARQIEGIASLKSQYGLWGQKMLRGVQGVLHRFILNRVRNECNRAIQ